MDESISVETIQLNYYLSSDATTTSFSLKLLFRSNFGNFLSTTKKHGKKVGKLLFQPKLFFSFVLIYQIEQNQYCSIFEISQHYKNNKYLQNWANILNNIKKIELFQKLYCLLKSCPYFFYQSINFNLLLVGKVFIFKS